MNATNLSCNTSSEPVRELRRAAQELVARASDYVYELSRPHSPATWLLLTDDLIRSIRAAEAALAELRRLENLR